MITNAFEEMRDLMVRVPLYEKSYNASRISRPEKNLPDLQELKKKCHGNLKEYAEELDRLAHMRKSIDAAYNAALKVVRSIKDGRSCPSEEAYIRVGEAVHDAWCIGEKKKYFDPGRNGKQWQFLSSMAIGWTEFEKDMKYVSIALEALGYPSFMSIRDTVEGYYETKASALSITPESEAKRWEELYQGEAPGTVPKGTKDAEIALEMMAEHIRETENRSL